MVDRALKSFASLTGHPATGAWLAPGRLNLIGEHTDYNDGFALPIALNRGVVIAAAPRTDRLLRLYSHQRPSEPLTVSSDDLRPGEIDSWAAYPAGVLGVLAREGHDLGGLDLVIDSDLPTGAGLSSSAALTCGVALACNELYDLDLPRRALVRIAQRAEQDFVCVPVGLLDQTASLLCNPEHALLLDARDLSTEQIPLNLRESGLALLVVDTHVSRELRDGNYADLRRTCGRAAELLGLPALRDLEPNELDDACAFLEDPRMAGHVRHVVTENERVLEAASHLRAGAISSVGPLLSASHMSLRDNLGVSSPALDAVVEATLAADGCGARLTGAGFGGSAFALVPTDSAHAVRRAIARELVHRGFPEPEVFEVVPSAGARRAA